MLSIFFIVVYLGLGSLYLCFYSKKLFGFEIVNLIVRVNIITALHLTREVGTRSGVVLVGLVVILLSQCIKIILENKREETQRSSNIDIALATVVLISGTLGFIQAGSDIQAGTNTDKVFKVMIMLAMLSYLIFWLIRMIIIFCKAIQDYCAQLAIQIEEI